MPKAPTFEKLFTDFFWDREAPMSIYLGELFADKLEGFVLRHRFNVGGKKVFNDT